MSAIWINQAMSSQRDTVRLVREAIPAARVVASHRHEREEILSEAHVGIAEPEREDGDYAAWALSTAISLKAGLLLSVRGRGPIAALRADFEAAGIRIACGTWDPATIETCDRKDLFAAAMRAAGLPVPETRLARDAASLRAAIAELAAPGAPACVKPAEGVYGRGFWILDPGASLMESLMDVHLTGLPRRLPARILEDAMSALDPEPVVVMEFLPGAEHSVDSACDDGELVAAACRLKEASRQVVRDSGPEVDLARAVVRTLRLDGLVNVQTRAAADGTPRILEVNTRPSGGIGSSAAAGINLPGILARRLLGLSPAPYAPMVPAAVRILDTPLLMQRGTAALSAGTQRERAA